MPPKNKPQPTKEEKEFLIGWIENSLTKVDCTAPKDPGRVTIRRLNRAEYNNTIRDLCGVDFKPADDFPADDVGYGFDNIGDVLSFQPILLEKYLAAADKILEAAVPPLGPVRHRQSRATARRTSRRHPAVGPDSGEPQRPAADRLHHRGVGVPGEVQLPGRPASTSSGSAGGAHRPATSPRRWPSGWTART